MKTREVHYVVFFSPGTFVCEQSSKPIASWDRAAAVELANGIVERYNAKPYGFQFVTNLEADAIPDGRGGSLKVEPKELKRSGTHFLGGTLLPFDEIPDDSEHSILRSNMRSNDWPICIENRNSWRFTGKFEERDCIVGPSGEIVRSGTDADLVEYRARKLREFQEHRDRDRAAWEARNATVSA